MDLVIISRQVIFNTYVVVVSISHFPDDSVRVQWYNEMTEAIPV